MTDKTNFRARLDAALEEMRHANDCTGDPARVTSWATVACAEALSLLVDAHLPAPDPEPEPDPDPRESLPDDTLVGHGWVMGWGGSYLLKPDGDGFFTRWTGDKWGATGHWSGPELVALRFATVGHLRRVGLPESEWPEITAPEPEPAEPQQSTVVLVYGEALQRIIDHWYVVGEETALTWADVCHRGKPTVIYTPKEQ